MADDAAGAVRRTPRPAGAVPALWWSPSEQALWEKDEDGYFCPDYYPIRSNTVLPVDAVQLAPVPSVARGERAGAIKGGTVIDWVKQMVAEYAEEVGSPPPPEIVAHITVAVLREMGWERRPVVLLRAEDCACPVGGDCPHGPEPVDALDLAVWLHAESEWWLSQYKHDVTLWKRQVDEQHAELAKLHAAAVEVKRLDDEAYRRHREALYAALGCTGPEGSLIVLITENVAKVVAERDALLPRLADLTEAAGKQRSTEWLRTCATLPMEEWPPAPAYKGSMVPAAELEQLRSDGAKLFAVTEKFQAERDALQARLDAVPNILRQHYLAWIKCDHDQQMDNPQCACSKVDLGWHPTVGDAVNAWIEHVRAALQGDQPTEPETRCMNGPAKQHTLRMGEIIKALRAAAVNGQLPATVEPLPFAKLARAIVDHWPTGEADRG